ncbi:hypothetical protein HCG51_00775 [Tolypothrix sp. PCC 7910]|uniref:hypothetical protein n=1 Tax=Tolypothrix sp. PCC 7910 TaxID=2099387 RepID=UPI001427739F|nr:hypothetical protein [Tolypothrix sp. PCC 7910]QIR35424.1 hypothetical protein HCG51_00775 [Tolypothrix sp. PCC 7910]
MIDLEHFGFFFLILTVMILTLNEMSLALDEFDIESFSLWTGIAAVIAGLPMIFYRVLAF